MMDRRKATVAAAYDAIGGAYLAWSSRVLDPRDRMLDELSRRLAPGARVLDLGCGAGIPPTRLLASRFSVTGVDISEGQVEAARRNVPEASFVHADLAELDVPPGSFDGVTALYAISHVPREEHADLFRRVARWLGPGGLFLATLGASDSPDWTGEWLGRPMFFSAYDAGINRKLLLDAGFRLLIDEVVLSQEPEGPVPFLWVLASPLPDDPADAGPSSDRALPCRHATTLANPYGHRGRRSRDRSRHARDRPGRRLPVRARVPAPGRVPDPSRPGRIAG